MQQYALNSYNDGTPSQEPLTLEEVKAHLRVDVNAEDSLIENLITAARVYVENDIGRALVTQSLVMKLPGFPYPLELAHPPVQSVTSITYIDLDGAEQTLSESLYTVDLDSLQPNIVPSWGNVYPAVRDVPNPVTVIFVAGYGDADAVPMPLKQAMLMLIGGMYENREAVAPITITHVPMTYEFLVSAYRIPRF